MGIVSKKRNANMELLRMISIFMVIILHALGKGNCLVNTALDHSANALIAWFIEILSISAVNIFVLISGYFLVDAGFKLRRLIELVLEAVFYGIFGLLVCAALGIDFGMQINTYFMLLTFLPIHMDVFWFVTIYILIYILQPILSAGIKALSKKQFGTVIIFLLIYTCLVKSFLPFKMETDMAGYDLIWFLTVFLIGAYFKLFGFKHLKDSKKGILVFFGATIVVFLEQLALDYAITNLGRLEFLKDCYIAYNNVFVILQAVGIFAFFVNKKPMGEKAGKVICFLSPMTLGVYLAHENLCFRYQWQKWLGIYDSICEPTYMFLLKLIGGAIVVYVCGTVIDYLRIQLFKVVGKLFEKKNEA